MHSVTQFEGRALSRKPATASLCASVVGFAALLVLSACSADGGSATSEGGRVGSGENEGVSALEQLSGDQLCGLLSAETIEQGLDITVEGSEGTERGRAPEMQPPYFLTRSCDYSGTDGWAPSTYVTGEWDEDESDQQVLDRVFTDITGEADSVGEYEPVPGLGTVAGFGSDATLSEGGVAGRALGVVFYLGDERLLLSIELLGSAELEQVRPLAEELLTRLEDALR
jgi:hypothetical protein